MMVRAGNESSDILHIGFDDTDSLKCKCTTHLAFRIVDYLLNLEARFIDYPLLIRLNPNVPWKTRGNGAICLRIKTKNHERIVEYIKQAIPDGSEIGEGANPGVAFLTGEQVPNALKELSKIALFDIVSTYEAEKIARQQHIQYFTFGNGQGLVGSLAAIGSLLLGDHTFEAIAYRKLENCGTNRILEPSRVIEFNKDTFPNTFNNYDEKNRRVLITPHGPDPVFCGIRGENPEVVVQSLKKLNIAEDLDGYMVFRSNQGTNMHLQSALRLEELKPFTAGYIICKVSKKPQLIFGGHAIFEVENRNGITCPVAVYEPTGLTDLASKLELDDIVQMGCSVRNSTSNFPKILNVEYILLLRLGERISLANPLCKWCGKRMKSEGRNKGFECHNCGFKDREAKKTCAKQKRNISRGLYIPTPKAHRHLTKPIQRYGMEKVPLHEGLRSELFSKWFYSSCNTAGFPYFT
jgi:tRNA(Ile2)-agmatinylcytidine synthase